MDRTGVIIVGGGQAGLVMSRELSERGVPHVVLERGLVGQAWRDRWDNFQLVTPNWSLDLPGHPYDGDDPNGFMARDEVVAYLERYADAVKAPVLEHTPVRRVRQEDGHFVVETDEATFSAPQLVLATGAFQKLTAPKAADSLPTRVTQIGLGEYRNPGQLPDGDVLIIGSGQSGCQLAEELQDYGRDVTLACGRAPWAPRVVGDHDVFWWLLEGGFFDVPASEIPREARLFSNPLVTGHDGGRDMNLRTLAERGIRLTGHFLGAEGETARLADDLPESVAWGDAAYQRFSEYFSATAERLGLTDPALSAPSPFAADAPTELDLREVSTVVFTTGFRPEYAAWLPWKEAFDEVGFPIQQDGSSTVVPGLHFLGTHFLRNRRSSTLNGVGRDAEQLAARIAGT